MPQPTLSDVHVSVPLTGISIAYIQSEADFIASKVFPTVPVPKQADKYFTYTKNDWFRDEARLRAPGTESAGGGFNLTTGDYSCDIWAYHKDVPDPIRANADTAINVDNDATRFVSQRLLIRNERLWAVNYFTAGIWGKDYTGVAAAPSTNQFIQWDDFASSDPVNDIKVGRMYIKSITGFKPNTLVLGEEVFETLKLHPDIIDRYKYTNSNVITKDMLARLFEIDNLYIGGGVYATNNEGGTEAYAFITGKGALLCYVTPTPSLLIPTAGYTFGWTGLTMMGTSVKIKKFRMENLESDRIEGEFAFDQKVVAADLGAFFTTAIS